MGMGILIMGLAIGLGGDPDNGISHVGRGILIMGLAMGLGEILTDELCMWVRDYDTGINFLQWHYPWRGF